MNAPRTNMFATYNKNRMDVRVISVLILSENAVGKDSGVKIDNEIWNTFHCLLFFTVIVNHIIHVRFYT